MLSFTGLGCLVALVLLMGSDGAALPYTTTHEHITTLTHDNFRQTVLEQDPLWVVEYYAPWCGHCKTFAPEYEKAAKSLEGIVKFGAVNADDKNAAGIAQAYKVEGYPTIQFFPTDLVEVEEGQFTKSPTQYQQERTANTLVKWVLSMMPTKHIARVVDEASSAEFLKKFEDDNMPKVLLFSNKKVIAPLYISLSLDFKYRAIFGFVPPDKSADELRAKYKVEKFPAIVVLGEDDEYHMYEGEIAKAPLAEFVKAHALPAAMRAQMMQKVLAEDGAARKQEKELKRAMNAPKPAILNTTDQWKKMCLERMVGVCALAILDPADSGFDRQMTTLSDVAKLLPTKVSSLSVQIAILDGPTNYEIADFFESGQNGYPSMVFLQPKRGRFIALVGSFTKDGIVSFVENKVVSAPGKAFEAKSVPAFVEPIAADEE